jgi:biotin carboxyl carrier protein
MVKVKSKEKEYIVNFTDREKTKGTLNGNAFSWDIIKVKENSFHIILDDRSYLAELVNYNPENKTFTVKVNGNKYELQLFDRYDELLHKMGFDGAGSVKIKEVKAPMPGLVLDVAVEAGQAVKAGDTLLVLEAMKMENILKSPADGVVKKINVKKRDAVEKNAVLISFE